MPETTRAYFERMVTADTDECIEWPFARATNGYGRLCLDGHVVGVHVLACERAHGPRPDGFEAAHQPLVCHNRACFNPRHLRWATRSENIRDAIIDGTHQTGRRSNLSPDDVREIRARFAAGERSLGRKFGVSNLVIRAVVRRENGWDRTP